MCVQRVIYVHSVLILSNYVSKVQFQRFPSRFSSNSHLNFWFTIVSIYLNLSLSLQRYISVLLYSLKAVPIFSYGIGLVRSFHLFSINFLSTCIFQSNNNSKRIHHKPTSLSLCSCSSSFFVCNFSSQVLQYWCHKPYYLY